MKTEAENIAAQSIHRILSLTKASELLDILAQSLTYCHKHASVPFSADLEYTSRGSARLHKRFPAGGIRRAARCGRGRLKQNVQRRRCHSARYHRTPWRAAASPKQS